MKLFTRKNFQRALFILACLVTIVFLLWQFENFRGRRAWEKHKAAALARGQVIEAKDLIPPPIPDASNFAAIPLFKPLFDYAPGTQKHKDEPAADKSSSTLIPCPNTTHPPTCPHRTHGSLDSWTFVSFWLELLTGRLQARTKWVHR